MNLQPTAEKGLRLDLGCGSVKKEGTIGIDIMSLPGVDQVLDMESQPLPFADRSVEYVYSSHFLEHTTVPGNILCEIGRVCMDGAQLELWTPYAWHNDAVLPGHYIFFTEEYYLHICVLFPDFWREALRSRWVLNEVQYVISDDILAALAAQNIDVGFAVKHMVNIVKEFCVRITVFHDSAPEPPPPFKRTYSSSRDGQRHILLGKVSPVSNGSSSSSEPRVPLQRLRRLVPKPLKRLIKSVIYPN